MWLRVAAVLILLASALPAHAEEIERAEGLDPPTDIAETAGELLLDAWERQDHQHFDAYLRAQWHSGFQLAHALVQSFLRSHDVDGSRSAVLPMVRRVAQMTRDEPSHPALLAAIERWERMPESAWAQECHLARAAYRLHLFWQSGLHRATVAAFPPIARDVEAAPHSYFALCCRQCVGTAYKAQGDAGRGYPWMMETGRLATSAQWYRPAAWAYYRASTFDVQADQLDDARQAGWQAVRASNDPAILSWYARWYASASVDDPARLLEIVAIGIPAAEQAGLKGRWRSMLRLAHQAQLRLERPDAAAEAATALLATAGEGDADVAREARLLLAMAHSRQGDFATALDELEQAVTPTGSNPALHARILLELASTYIALRQGELALEAADQALQLLRASGSALGTALIAIADAHMLLEQWSQASVALDEAAASRNPPEVQAELTTRAGHIAALRQGWEEAESRYREALAQVADGDPRTRSGAILGLGALEISGSRHEQAELRLRELLATLPKSHALRPTVLGRLAEVAEARGNHSGALRLVVRAMTALRDQLRGLAPSEARPLRRQMHQLAVRGMRANLAAEGSAEQAFWLLEMDRGSQLAAALRRAEHNIDLPAPLASEQHASLERVAATHARLLSAYRPDVTDAQRAGAIADYEAAWRARGAVVRRIDRAVRGRGREARDLLDLSAWQASLDPHERALAWMVVDDQLVRLAVSPTRAALSAVPMGALTDEIEALRLSLASPSTFDADRAQLIYRQLFGASGGILAGGTRWLLALPPSLAAIPVSALRTPRRKFLVEEVETVRVLSATVHNALRQRPPT
ncbi:MAG: hypothetical protein KC766_36940, partial [Myxococcales bacterium]|nr:hypothetical protein [Myxococcales bacterium]